MNDKLSKLFKASTPAVLPRSLAEIDGSWHPLYADSKLEG